MLLEIAKSPLWCRRGLALSYVLMAIAAVVPFGPKLESVSVASIGVDKIAHFAGFGCTALFARGAARGSTWWKRALLVALAAVFGVAIGWLQCYLSYRTFNPLDILANLSGVAFGVLIAQGAARLLRGVEVEVQ